MKLYLSSKDIFGAKRVLVNLPRNAKQTLFSLADGERFRDEVSLPGPNCVLLDLIFVTSQIALASRFYLH